MGIFSRKEENEKREIKGELNEIQLKNLAKELQEEKKSDIVKIKNKDYQGRINTEFKKTKGMPIKKAGKIPFLKKKTYAKEINWKLELKRELDKIEPDKKRLTAIKNKLEKEIEIEELPLKTPYLEMIRADGSKEWFEGVKAGTLEITRSDESIAYINLDKGKLITDEIRNIDGRVVQGWVCFENDHMPLPTNVFMDSKTVHQNYEEVMKNRKDIQTERLNARSNLIWTIIIGIILMGALIFVAVPVVTGQNIGDMLPMPSAEESVNATCRVCTGDLGALSPEEIQIIKQYRAEINRGG